jgi:hypothetical protein
MDTYSHAIPAMQEEAATPIAELVLADWRAHLSKLLFNSPV